MTSTDKALQYFDSLEEVEIDFMIGNWRGEGYPTGHRLDGLLEVYHWHGKRFESSEKVHPLVFNSLSRKLVNVNPSRMRAALRFPMPRSKIAGRIFQLLLPFLTTSRSKARLRMTTYRGKTSATMIYDQLPVIDVFRKIDRQTIMGVMDLKGMENPFFFLLHREAATREERK